MTITQMKQALEEGKSTSVELVKDTLSKIEKYDYLHSIIEVNPDALEIAKRCDEHIGEKGPLHGVPILVKDNVNTGDQMATSAGSVALAKNVAKEDAPVVKLLRQGGAVIVGKTNMTEFANYMCDFRLDEKMPNGYSSRGGQTIHPVSEKIDPSGSSTGSAVAVATGIVPGAVGSETYGSIISPAQKCGIVGVKPTDGLISKEGVIPISFTLDTLGPMATTVSDVATMLEVMGGKSYPMKHQSSEISIGVCTAGAEDESWPPSQLWRRANKELVESMKRLGMKVKDVPGDEVKDFASMRGDLFVFPIMEYEFRYGLNRYLASAKEHSPEIPGSLTEIIEYNKQHKEVALKYGQGNLINGNNVQGNWREAQVYRKAIRERDEAIERLKNYFDQQRIDVLMMMSAHCGIGAATGFPSITFPIGESDDGLQAGCMLVARPFEEDVLLSAAKMLEQSCD